MVNQPHFSAAAEAKADMMLRKMGYDPAVVRSQAAKRQQHWVRILGKARRWMDTVDLLDEVEQFLIRRAADSEDPVAEALIVRVHTKRLFLERQLKMGLRD